jgi:ABC-2 type transport system ATP-binding protein
MSSAIRIRGVEKTFGSTRAVRSLDLDVPQGSICGFLGPNGAGKSTTIRMIMSIIYPDAGTIEVLGGRALESKDRIGYLPEERGLYRKMRVGKFLEYIGRLKGLDSNVIAERVSSGLQRVMLPDVARKRCQELSKGMQQKIQFLAAIIHDPKLLILDEPFSGLDPVNAALLNDLIRQQHERGTTIIFSTHVLHQAEQICDRIFLINHGIKLLDATMEQIHQQFDPRTILVEPLDSNLDLTGLPGVERVRQHGTENWQEIALEPQADPQEVMRAVLDTAPLRSLRLRRLSLDEVFVRLVREDEGADAAERAREELSHV